MKQLRATTRVEAFTLIELLVVILIIVVLGAILLPPRPPGKQPALSIACMNNQKQIGLAFEMWASDNDQNISQQAPTTNELGMRTDVTNLKFPWQVSMTNGGTWELISGGQAVSQFQVLSDILKAPQVFVCPSDKVKQWASDINMMGNSNISYFVNVEASPTKNSANTILTGDRHLQAGNNPVKPGLFIYTNGMAMGWTRELHPTLQGGMMSFADGHVERVIMKDDELTKLLKRQNLASARLLVP